MTKIIKMCLLLTCIIAVSITIYSCAKELDKNGVDLQQEMNLISTNSAHALIKPTSAMLDFSCDDASLGNCTSQTYAVRVFIITLPDYPNCTFLVTTMYRSCAAGADFKIIEFRSLNTSPPGNECEAWTNDFDAYVLMGTTELNNWLADFNKKLVIGIGKALATEFGIYCSGTTTLKVAGYTEGNCTRTCAYRLDGQGLAIIKTPCGTGCCSTIFELCLDANDVPIVTAISSTSSAGSQCNPNGPTINCPSVTVYWGFCAQQCSIFN